MKPGAAVLPPAWYKVALLESVVKGGALPSPWCFS